MSRATASEATQLFWIAVLGLTDTVNLAAAQARGHDDLLRGPVCLVGRAIVAFGIQRICVSI